MLRVTKEHVLWRKAMISIKMEPLVSSNNKPLSTLLNIRTTIKQVLRASTGSFKASYLVVIPLSLIFLSCGVKLTSRDPRIDIGENNPTDNNSEISGIETVTRILPDSGVPIVSLHETKNGSLISIDQSGRIWIHQPEESQRTASRKETGSDHLEPRGERELLYSFGEKPLSIAFHQNRGLIALTFVNRVVLLELDSPNSVKAFGDLKGRFLDLVFHPNGDSILVTVGDNRVYRWRFNAPERNNILLGEKNKKLEKYIGHSSIVSALEYHPFGRVFFSGDWSGALMAWLTYDVDPYGGSFDRNIFTGRFYADLTAKELRPATLDEIINSIKVNDNGQWLTVGFGNGTLELWQIRGFRRVARVEAHPGGFQSIDFKGKTVTTLGRDGRVVQWLIEKHSEGINEVIYDLTRKRQSRASGASSLMVDSRDVVWIGTHSGKVKTIEKWVYK